MEGEPSKKQKKMKMEGEEEEDVKMEEEEEEDVMKNPLSWWSPSPSPSTESSSSPPPSLFEPWVLPVLSMSFEKAVEFRNESADGATFEEDVETLLSSDGANLLTSGIIGDGDEKKVGLDELRGKVVGLYFYNTRRVYEEEIAFDTLESMYKELTSSKMGVNFVVVFICLRIDGHRDTSGERTFRKHFKGKPWFASPFSNWKANQKLFAKFCYLSDPCNGPRLVIIRPEEKIAHTYAWDIYQEYGIEAYPFSKSKVTEIEVARLKSLTLNSVCSTKHHWFSFNVRGEKEWAPAASLVDHLSGKSVIFFLTTEPDKYSYGGQQDKLIHNQVIEWYSKMKNELQEEFEMVRVIYSCNESLRKGVTERRSSDWKNMPGLEFVPDDLDEMAAVYQMFFKAAGNASYDFLPVFVAFGQDGKFKNMTTSIDRFLLNDDDSCGMMKFFDDSHLVDEVRNYIARCKRWISGMEETGMRYLAREKMRIAAHPYTC